jgi:hypothetical protein
VPPYFQHRPSLEVATRQGQPRSALIIGHHLERDPLVMLARPVTSAGDFAATAGRVDNPCVAKPLKCRLRLHNWEHRENPETHEYYQVCLRCNAYRDKGNAAPGAGAAGVTGAGI